MSTEAAPTAVSARRGGQEQTAIRVRPYLPFYHISSNANLSLFPFPTGNPTLSPPSLLQSPGTIFAHQFERVVLKCEVSGNPEPVVTWYKDDMEIIGATRNELIIPEADLADRAVYYCTASNSLGSVTSEQAFLNIKGWHGITVFEVTVHKMH